MTHTPNWQERCRRAEMIAERLASESAWLIRALTACGHGELCPKIMKDAKAAIEVWQAHKESMLTLAQARQEPC